MNALEQIVINPLSIMNCLYSMYNHLMMIYAEFMIKNKTMANKKCHVAFLCYLKLLLLWVYTQKTPVGS